MSSNFTILTTSIPGKTLYTQRDFSEAFLIFSACVCECVQKDLGAPKYHKKKKVLLLK